MTRNNAFGHVVVTGGAGFIGAHVCAALLGCGERVTVVDDLSTGRAANVAGLKKRPGFTLVTADVTAPLNIHTPVGAVLHLACAGSPTVFTRQPVQTLQAGSVGTFHALELARVHDARFLLASSSEVYGDPQVSPQREDYRGHVDPTGPRSCYDEAKRFAEAATVAYQQHYGLDTAIVRPFNVYGPGMWPDDGRVVAAFASAALNGGELTLHGDGSQTRSLCYVDDFVTGLLALLYSDEAGPVNIGSDEEVTMAELAKTIIDAAGAGSIVFAPARDQDVATRRPDISLARRSLGWEPSTSLHDGLDATVAWLRERIAEGR